MGSEERYTVELEPGVQKKLKFANLEACSEEPTYKKTKSHGDDCSGLNGTGAKMVNPLDDYQKCPTKKERVQAARAAMKEHVKNTNLHSENNDIQENQLITGDRVRVGGLNGAIE